MRPIKSGLPTIHFEVGELEYSIKVESYSPPTPDTRDGPGDTGECELASFATISVNGIDVGETTYGILLLSLAADAPHAINGPYIDDAERLVYDKAMDACADMEPDDPPEYGNERDYRDHSWDDYSDY